MNNEEKELLLKDLSGRLPYHTKIDTGVEGIATLDGTLYELNRFNLECNNEAFLPYLRSMSSMTEEEKTEYFLLKHRDNDRDDNIILVDEASMLIDWLNKHHFDYRGLIEKGLALEAPENMYVL